MDHPSAPHLVLKRRDLQSYLFVKALWPSAMHVVATRIGGHCKSVWHWQTKHTHHLGQVGTFTAQ
jgi:hypothetical protein